MEIDTLFQLKQEKSKLWVILLGVNHYQDPQLRSLNFAVADCQGLAESLNAATTDFPNREILTHCGFTELAPLHFADVAVSLDTLFDAEHGVQARDTVIFFFSGHGVLDPQTQQLYLCLSDTGLEQLSTTALSVQHLLQRLQTSQAMQQVIILDACHSGRMEWLGQTASNFIPTLEAALQDHASHDQDFYALLSCSGQDQLSWEFPDLQHSVFSYFLIEGIRGAAADEVGQIDVDRLYRYVRDRTRTFVSDRLGKQQIPRHIKAGCQDIIIGLNPATAVLSPNLGPLSEREQQYSHAIWEALRQEYPLGAVQRQVLCRKAEELMLPQSHIERLEAAQIAHFEQDFDNYCQRAIALLNQAYPPTPELLAPLKQKLGLSTALWHQLYQKALAQFTRQKEERINEQLVQQEYRQYRARYRHVLYQEHAPNLSTRYRLLDGQQSLPLSYLI